jgi:hypothetical protein
VEEELVDKAEADTELERDGGVAGAVFGMRDGEVRLIAEAGGPLSVDSGNAIACTCDKKLQNRKLH